MRYASGPSRRDPWVLMRMLSEWLTSFRNPNDPVCFAFGIPHEFLLARPLRIRRLFHALLSESALILTRYALPNPVDSYLIVVLGKDDSYSLRFPTVFRPLLAPLSERLHSYSPLSLTHRIASFGESVPDGNPLAVYRS